MKEVQFIEIIGLTDKQQFFVNDDNEVESCNGIKINFGMRTVNYEKYGFSDVPDIIRLLNRVCDNYLKSVGEIPVTLVKSIDKLLSRCGYWGKVTTDRCSYAEELIIEHEGAKHYIKQSRY